MPCAQRRSAPERVRTRGGGTERVFFSITLTKRIYVYRAQRTEKRPGGTCWPTTDNTFHTWRAQPWGNHLKERFLSLFFFLFVFICHPYFSFSLWSSYLLFSCYPHFFLSSFFHPQVCGTRFTDTPWLDGITLIGKTTTTTISTWLDKNKKKWNA